MVHKVQHIHILECYTCSKARADPQEKTRKFTVRGDQQRATRKPMEQRKIYKFFETNKNEIATYLNVQNAEKKF